MRKIGEHHSGRRDNEKRDLIETRIIKDPIEVEARLESLSVDKAGLERTARAALAASRNVTSFNAINASGTNAYQEGVAALRREYIPRNHGWRIERPNNVECIYNPEIEILIGFSNVNQAFDEEIEPKPRSRKGPGAERICNASLFDYLPRYAPPIIKKINLYYLMVDGKGAFELSLPIVQNKTFVSYIERILISDGSDNPSVTLPIDEKDAISNFDPTVIRR